MPTEPTSVPVWDRFVRFAHWFLVAAFTTAYFSGGEFMPLHEIAGWCVLGTVLSRVSRARRRLREVLIAARA